MTQKESFSINRLLSLAGIFGSILVFAVILYVAYLPGLPPAVDHEVGEKRKQTADEARAAGQAKLTGYVKNKDTGAIQIPIELAMSLTISDYQAEESGIIKN